MANFENYENPYQLREYVEKVLIPHIYEVLVDSYGFASDDYDNDNTNDHVCEIIDGLEEVIYTYQAKKIAQLYNYDPFTRESEITGERFNSWNEMAFEQIYIMFMDAYSEQLV